MSRDNSSPNKPAASAWDIMLNQAERSLPATSATSTAKGTKKDNLGQTGGADQKGMKPDFKIAADGVVEITTRELGVVSALRNAMTAMQKEKQEYIRVCGRPNGIGQPMPLVLVWDAAVITKKRPDMMSSISRVSINGAADRARMMYAAHPGQRLGVPCGLVTLDKRKNAERYNAAEGRQGGAVPKVVEVARQGILEKLPLMGVMTPLNWKP